jgi:hypothetical protein
VAEVVAHQPLDPLTRFGTGIAEQVRGPLLHVVAEDVLVASGVQMQRRPHAQQEVLGLIEARRVGGPAPQEQRVGQHRDGACRGEIAKRAWRFLHVRLELIQRVVETGVALIDELQERL